MEIQGVTETVQNYLREQIITGALAANTRLNEVEIAKTLGISRSPVREALRLLENGNFITRIPRRGAYVADLNSESLEQVYEARTAIESASVDILEKKNITIFEKAEIALNAASSMTMPPLENTKEMFHYVMTFSDFHVGLIEATGNEYLVEFYKSITFDMARYQFICMYLGISANSRNNHESILSNLKKGRFKWAKKELLHHIKDTKSQVKAEIRKREAQGKASHH